MDAPETPENPHKNLKRCRKCQVYKPIREFDLPRHRECTACRRRKNLPIVEAWLAHQAPVPTEPTELEVWAAQQSGFKPDEPMRALTTMWAGNNKYQRERARSEAIAKERFDKARGIPVRTPKYATVKVCRRCQQTKHVSAYNNPRFRICAACDGPPIT